MMNEFLLLHVWLLDVAEFDDVGLFTSQDKLMEYCENEGIALRKICKLDGDIEMLDLNASSYAEEIEVFA